MLLRRRESAFSRIPRCIASQTFAPWHLHPEHKGVNARVGLKNPSTKVSRGDRTEFMSARKAVSGEGWGQIRGVV